MSQPWMSDLIGVLRGVKTVTNAILKHQEDAIKHTLQTSSLKTCVEKCVVDGIKTMNNIEPSKVPVSFKNK